MAECRGKDGEAIVRVALTEGCLAWPDDREQDLCVQHLSSIEPRGEMWLIDVYEPEVLDWYLGTRGLPPVRPKPVRGTTEGER